MATTHVKVLEQGLIRDEYDILKLDIVDLGRRNGYWKNPADALRYLVTTLAGRAYYSIKQCDLCEAPARDDWPGWEHVGYHEEMGKLYWNWFHARYTGETSFSDSPDFFGHLRFEDGHTAQFWGDIGQVSLSGFAAALNQMSTHDIWISVLNEKKQISIEALEDFWDRF